jgi:molybdopterin converting factor small subunit
MTTEQNIFQRIKDVVEHSSLSVLQQREFLLLFAQTKEQALKPVLDLLSKDSTWVEKLYENYEAKKHAIVTGSMDAWNDVVQKEQKVVAA